MDPDASGVEALRAAGQIEAPELIAPLAGRCDRVVAIAIEVCQPCAHRLGVMLAQILDVAHFKAGRLSRFQRRRNVDHLAVWKDKAAQESAATLAASAALIGDCMIQKEAARAQRGVRGAKIIAEPGTADVLEHSDAHDLVELLAAQLAIVAARRVRDPSGRLQRSAALPLRTAAGSV